MENITFSNAHKSRFTSDMLDDYYNFGGIKSDHEIS